ncbi:alpha-D-ribose 1-methylphosphonate 5-triphosphate diphosphatase [Roseobacteraceae bacterium S113]
MTTTELWLDGRWLGADGFVDGPLGLTGANLGDPGSGARRISAAGKLILPGLVDIHGDGFERHLAPRRGAMTNLVSGLRSAEAELAINGITTAVLAQFWSWEGGLRAPEFAQKVFDGLDEIKAEVVTDLRVQLRIETHYLSAIPDVLAAIARHKIGYVAFNDHLPHKRLDEGRKPPRLVGTALKSGRSPEAHLAFMQELHAQADAVPAAMDELCADFAAQGILMASHDDTTPEDRAEWAGRGAAISEFPETREAIEACRATGAGVIMGAPNVVRGASHKGNISARELTQEGLVDALASDYHFPSMRQAMISLDRPLEESWPLISEGPARLLGLTDRGTLAPGKRADIVVIDEDTRQVELTIAGGKISFARGDMATRLL